MEHHDFSQMLKSLWPIIILIVWTLFSLPAQKRKKEQEELKRRKRQQELEREQNAPQGTQENRPTEHLKNTPKPEWKRSLEQVFEEMGFPLEHEEKIPPAEQPAQKTMNEETKSSRPIEIKPGSSRPTMEHESIEDSRSLEDLTPEVPPEKPINKTKKNGPVPIIKENTYSLGISPIDDKKAYATSSVSIAESASEDSPKKTTEEFQKFVVWAELLGKPVALREEF
jgi:hypothetical protein